MRVSRLLLVLGLLLAAGAACGSWALGEAGSPRSGAASAAGATGAAAGAGGRLDSGPRSAAAGRRSLQQATQAPLVQGKLPVHRQASPVPQASQRGQPACRYSERTESLPTPRRPSHPAPGQPHCAAGGRPRDVRDQLGCVGRELDGRVAGACLAAATLVALLRARATPTHACPAFAAVPIGCFMCCHFFA